jgi:hypothetical protein
MGKLTPALTGSRGSLPSGLLTACTPPRIGVWLENGDNSHRQQVLSRPKKRGAGAEAPACDSCRYVPSVHGFSQIFAQGFIGFEVPVALDAGKTATQSLM